MGFFSFLRNSIARICKTCKKGVFLPEVLLGAHYMFGRDDATRKSSRAAVYSMYVKV